jgi:hypothetical protein
LIYGLAAARLKSIWKEEAREKQTANLKRGKDSSVCPNLDKRSEDPVHCNVKAAKTIGNTSHEGVAKASKVLNSGAKELVTAVDAGNIPVSVAAAISELPKDEQKQILQEPIEKIREKSKEIKKSKKLEKVREEKVAEAVIPEPAPMEPRAYGKEMSGMLKGLSKF